MRGKREKLFECSYGTPSNEGRLVVPAWTAVEAATTAGEIVHRAGIALSGLITVRDRTGKVVLEVAALPLGGAGATGVA